MFNGKGSPAPYRPKNPTSKQMLLFKKLGCRLLPLLLVFLVAGCVTVKVDLFEEAKPLKEKVISGYGRDKVLLVDVSGMIVETKRHSLLSLTTVTTPDRIKEVLDKAVKDSHIKAVVLRINSPGGTVSASDIILHELRSYKRETGVPIVACLIDRKSVV